MPRTHTRHPRRFLSAVRLAAGLALFLAAPAQAQVADVCVSFAGTNLNAATRASIIMKAQGHFTAAGLGPNNNPGVRVRDVTGQRPAGCQLGVVFGGLPAGLLGLANKRTHVCTVSLAAIRAGFPGAPADRICRIIGEIIAHEVGHLLCAVHQCAGGGRKRTRAGVVGCPGGPTIMSAGTCLRPAALGANPGAVAFNALSVRQMTAGVRQLKRQPARNWDLQAQFFEGALCVVEGRSHSEPIEDQGETLLPVDPVVNFTYDVAGRTDLFDFGWISSEGFFVDPLAEEDNPEHTLESQGGHFLHIALRGRDGTPYEGQVFPHRDFATLIFPGSGDSPGNSVHPDLGGDYFSQVDVLFDIDGNVVNAHLDTGPWGDSNGFYRATSADTQRPDCRILGRVTDPDGTVFLEILFQDSQSGLRRIHVTRGSNVEVLIPDFEPCTQAPVIVRARRIIPERGAALTLEAEDCAGNTRLCDPTQGVLRVPEGRTSVTRVFRGLLRADSALTITNGTPGLSAVAVRVNGVLAGVRQLRDGQQVTIDLARLTTRARNTIALTGVGAPGTSAEILIADGPP